MERRQVEEVTIVKAGGSHGLSVIFVDPDIFVAKVSFASPSTMELSGRNKYNVTHSYH